MKDFIEKIVLNSINTLKGEMVNVLQEVGKSLRSSSSTNEVIDDVHGEISTMHNDDAGTTNEWTENCRYQELSQSTMVAPGETGEVQRIVLTAESPLIQKKLPDNQPKSSNDLEKNAKGTDDKDADAQNNGCSGKIDDNNVHTANHNFCSAGICNDGDNARNGSGNSSIPGGGVFGNPNTIQTINAYGRNKRLNIMILGAAAGLIVCMLMLSLYQGELPGEVVGIISTVSGIFGSCLKDAYSFEFGSSRGSKDKDDKISSSILATLNHNTK
ncbi:MAG: hypothetical protein LBT90_03045 [Holosporaceae bacterium]|nr:hypothetical protein [Holosporaceae bacterium]